MKIAESLVLATETLSEAGIADARLEAEVLLRHVLGADRAGFFASVREDLRPPREHHMGHLVQRRVRHEPLAYITGHREFYGLDFAVNPGVLIPRQETELLVEKALEFCSSLRPDAQPTIADIGTGSGAIAIAIAHHAPRATIHATDTSPSALATADVNRHRHGVANRVHLHPGDLLGALTASVDLVVSNLPYVPTGEISDLALELRREPRSSLDGGGDGLDLIRRLLGQVAGRVRPYGRVLLEISPEQLESVCTAATASVPRAHVSFHRDLLGLPRAVEVRLDGTARNAAHPHRGARA